jgi:hypothetical protein
MSVHFFKESTQTINYQVLCEKAFENFPEEELFRLFIDKMAQGAGKFAYDKKQANGHSEPGYFEAMSNAIEDMKKTIGNRLTSDELIRIRSICINKVENLNDNSNKFVLGEYVIDIKKVSLEAKNEFKSDKLILTTKIMREIYLIDKNDDSYQQEYLSMLNPIYNTIVSNILITNVPNYIDNLFNEFYLICAKNLAINDEVFRADQIK